MVVFSNEVYGNFTAMSSRTLLTDHVCSSSTRGLLSARTWVTGIPEIPVQFRATGWKAIHYQPCVTHTLRGRVCRLVHTRCQLLSQQCVSDGRRNTCGVSVEWKWPDVNRSSGGKTCLGATLSTTNSIHIDLWPNLGLQWRTKEFYAGGGGSTNSVEDRENRDLRAVAP